MRIIDADALYDDVMERYCKDCEKRKGMKRGKWRVIYEIGEAPCRACDVDDLKMELDEAPTIDAVRVVRCKDCRWYISDWLKRDGTEDNRYAPNICNLHGRPHSETYFCADGEVKDETYRC